ncbi:MAG TPA: hypothetical protein VIJ41_07480 [Candidatus Nanopelagicales bacterium]
MSLAGYQRVLIGLLVQPASAFRVARGDFDEADLTDCERERLSAAARDAGVALTRRLHEGWRLTKLLTLLPLTFDVGDDEVMADRVASFWAQRLPTSLYFEDEAASFAQQVARSAPPGSLLQFTAEHEAEHVRRSRDVPARTRRRSRNGAHPLGIHGRTSD